MKTVLLVPGIFADAAARPALTHHFCNRNAAALIKYSREDACTDFLTTFMGAINAGSSWADSSCKNAAHFFNPVTRKGKWYFPHAVSEFRSHYARACSLARRKEYPEAAFYLGAAAHLVQDMCVPHHSLGILFDGHQSFENWACRNREEFAVTSEKESQPARPPVFWLLSNALQSQKYYPLVSEKSREKNFPLALSVLLPQAQRTSAGFYRQFIVNHI